MHLESLECRRMMAADLVYGVDVSTLPGVAQPYTVVPMGKGLATSLTLKTTDGATTTFKIKAGRASILLDGALTQDGKGPHAHFPGGPITVDAIILDPSTKASIVETHKNATANPTSPAPVTFNIGEIVGGTGAVGTVDLPDASLAGAMTAGTIDRLTLGTISDGSVTARTIGTVSAKNLSLATITATEPFTRGAVDIARIDGGDGIQGSTITSAGNIGTVTAGFMQNTVVTAAASAPAQPAGYQPTATVPTSASAFTAGATIHAILMSPDTTANGSVFAASRIDRLRLGELSGTGGGIAARSIGALSGSGIAVTRTLLPVIDLSATSGGVIVSPITTPSGVVPFSLGRADLKSAATIQAALAKANVAFTTTADDPDATVINQFSVNLFAG